MRRIFSGLALSLVAMGGSAEAQMTGAPKTVTFAGAAQPDLKLKDGKATVFDEGGEPLFVGDQAFVLQYARNPGAKIFEWNLARDRIRISPAGDPAAWVDCDDVEPAGIACSELQFSIGPDGGLRISQPVRRARLGAVRGGFTVPRRAAPSRAGVGRGVPNCPGDPRCPKM